MRYTNRMLSGAVLLVLVTCYYTMHAQSFNYRVGAWYFGAWNYELHWGIKYHAYTTAGLPGLRNSTDPWTGPRDAYCENPWHAKRLPELQAPGDYKASHKPAIGFYDITDDRVMKMHVKMAAKYGLDYFAFYSYIRPDGSETTTSSDAINKFIDIPESPTNEKYGMKFILGLHKESDDAVGLVNITNYIAFRDQLAATVVKHIKKGPGITAVRSCYMTTPDGRPIIIDRLKDEYFTSPAYHEIAISYLYEQVLIETGERPFILWACGQGRTVPPLTTTTYRGIMNQQYYSGTLGYNVGIYSGFSDLQSEHPDGVGASDPNYDGTFYKGYYTNQVNQCASNPTGCNLLNYIKSYHDHDTPTANYYFYLPSIVSGYDRRTSLNGLLRSTYIGNYFTDNTPGAFRSYLELLKMRYFDPVNNPGQYAYPDNNRFVLVYAWNEWGETSAIEPSEASGTEYLEEIQDAFGLTSRYTSSLTSDIAAFSTTYEEWASGQSFSTPAAGDPLADPDADGWTNLQEYAFDTNPNNATNNTANLPVVNVHGTTKEATIRYNRDYRKSDLVYHVELMRPYDNSNNYAASNFGWYVYTNEYRSGGSDIYMLNLTNCSTTVSGTIETHVESYLPLSSSWNLGLRLVIQLGCRIGSVRSVFPVNPDEIEWVSQASLSPEYHLWESVDNWAPVMLPKSSQSVYVPVVANGRYPVITEASSPAAGNAVFIRSNTHQQATIRIHNVSSGGASLKIKRN